MSKSYATQAGDTLSSIARKVLGSEQHASVLQASNPGVREPLGVGTVLVVPTIAGAPADGLITVPFANANEVAVLIGGEHFRFWSDIRVRRSLDGLSTIEFSAPFEPDDATFRRVFKPFSYKDLQANVGGEPLFFGTLIDVTPSLTPDARLAYVSGYSRPGVFEDCTPPATSPTEFIGQTLEAIAKTMAAPFGINVVFNEDAGASFEQVAITPAGKVLPFLTKLAKQRNLIITDDEAGNLVFERSVVAGRPVAVLREGGSPMVSASPTFNPQQYYSHVTGVEPVTLGLDGSNFTAKNPLLQGVLRPLVFDNPDVLGADVSTAVSAKLGRMYANMVSYTVMLSTWRDPSGALWRPNTTIKITAPGAMIYEPFEFLIRSVSLEKESKSETATLTLMLPGGFSGEAPRALPWDS